MQMKNILMIIDMTNDFIKGMCFENGEHHRGTLVVPNVEPIIKPIADIVNANPQAIIVKLKKDSFDGFINERGSPETMAWTLLNDLHPDLNIFIVGVVDEICVYHNAYSLRTIFRYPVTIIEGCTAPLDVENGKNAFDKLKNQVGVQFISISEYSKIPPMDYIVYLEDEHTSNSEEIKSAQFPPHNIKNTWGAMTISELRK